MRRDSRPEVYSTTDGLKLTDRDNTDGRVDENTKHLPLSLVVQAALEVLALPTQEECDMLQPSQAKLSQASFGFEKLCALFSICVFLCLSSCRGSEKLPAVQKLYFHRHSLVVSISRRYLHMHFQTNSCSRGLTARLVLVIKLNPSKSATEFHF